MGRAISVTQLYTTSRNELSFEGKWLASFGRPELKGSWSISGPPGNGKSALAIQIAMELTKWTRVYYDSLEEGNSRSLAMGFKRQQAEKARRKIIILDKEPIEELKERLRKKKAPRAVIVDSTQYTFLSVAEYFKLLKEFPNVLFVWISHEKSKEPQGLLAQKIEYDANVKVRVVGYRAFIKSRYLESGGPPFDVWPEGAAKFYNEF